MTLAYGVLFMEGDAERELVKQFFDMVREAEACRLREHGAAVSIQQNWRRFVVQKWIAGLNLYCSSIQSVFRGYVGRKKAEEKIMERNRERRMVFYDTMAVRMQRAWRGFYARKHKFDFFKRKQYISMIVKKNEELRLALQIFEEERKIVDQQLLKVKLNSEIDQHASHLHHLLVDIEHMDQETRRRHSAHRQKLGANIRLKEINLKQSAGLKKWMEEKVGPSKSYFRVKPIEETIPPAKLLKKAAGPFPSLYQLEKMKNRPLKPTLRVQTNYFDTEDSRKEEMRYWKSLNISENIFLSRVHFSIKKGDYFLKQDPYRVEQYGIKWYRETDPTKNVGFKDFKTIVPPIHGFD